MELTKAQKLILVRFIEDSKKKGDDLDFTYIQKVRRDVADRMIDLGLIKQEFGLSWQQTEFTNSDSYYGLTEDGVKIVELMESK